ncbi:MAG: beta-Ala-His dipeptidase [Armatimonadota bacterium]
MSQNSALDPIQVYAQLEPRELWRQFAALNAIPRPSGREGSACDYVASVGEAAGATVLRDARGNVVIQAPATPGREGAPAVAIQAHLDMVCEARPDVTHDFLSDPIRPRVEGEWVYATGTTLGADNGIGAAAGLAALTDPTVERGPLDLIFTVEEETGLHGAAHLDPELVRARLLINLDSEDPRELTVGCAGGSGAVLRLPVDREPVPAGWIGRELVVSGLKGGHSGVQIHERLANSNKLLVRALERVREAGIDFRLDRLHGGNAHNAIPRDAAATLALPREQLAALESAVAAARDEISAEWGDDEPGFALELRDAAEPAEPFSAADTVRAIDLLRDLPHGPLTWSQAFEGKVETSSNLAMVRTHTGILEIGTSSRSFVDAELDRLQAEIVQRGREAGAEVELREGYGGWEPNPGSPLLHTTASVYQQVFGRPAAVQVIHAGLECGVIASRLPGLDAISFGPRIEGAHTPEERVQIRTVEETWRLLQALLAALSGEQAPG